MFQISTRGDYGLLLLSALAESKREGKKCVSLTSLAEEKKLPLKYLSQIAHTLKEAGFLTSKEGRDGGYTLSKEPTEITLMDVLEVLEGPIAPVRCCKEKTDASCCASAANCGVKNTWQGATSLLTNYLKTHTLADTMKSAPDSVS